MITKGGTVETTTRLAQLDRILASAPLILYVLHLSTRKVEFGNSALPRVDGRDSWQAIEQYAENWEAQLHPEDRERVLAQFAVMRQTEDGIVRTLEMRIRDVRGEWRWLQSRHTALERGADGQVESIVGSLADITSQREAEHRADQRAAELTAVLENLPDLFFRLSRDGTILEYRGGKTGDLYVSPEMFLGKRLGDVMPPDVSQALAEGLLEVRASGGARSVRYSLAVPSGAKHFEARIAPLGSEFLALVRDVTGEVEGEQRLRESEKRYRNLVETSHDLIWSVDELGRWTYLNGEASRHILGYEPEEMLGRPFTDFQDAQTARRDMETFAKILQGQPHFHYQTEHIAKDGRRVSLSFNAVVHRDEQGRVLGTTGTARDITQRKQAEAALRLVEASFEHCSTAILWIRSDASIARANEAACRMHRMTREDLTLKSVPDIDPDYPAHLWDTHWAELREKKTMSFRSRHQDAAGRIFPVDITITMVVHEGEEFNFAFIRDITEEVKAEEAMRESEQRYRSLVEASPEPIALIAEERFTYANPAMLRLLGAAAPQAVVGERIVRYLHPNEHRAILERTARCLTTRETSPLRLTRMVRCDGSEVVVESRSCYCTFGGREAVQVMARDVTERITSEAARRESEERYRLLADGTDDLVSLIGVDGRRLYVSPSVARALGYAAEEVTLNNFPMQIHPDDIPATNRAREANLRGEATQLEYRARRKDGSYIWLDHRTIPLRGADGKMEKLLCSARDITQRKQAEAELLQREARLKLVNDIARGITSGMSAGRIVAHALAAVHQRFPRFRVCFSSVSAEGMLTFEHTVAPEGMMSLTGIQVDLNVASEFVAELRRLGTLAMPDITQDACFAPLAPIAMGAGTRAALISALVRDGRIVNVLFFCSPELHAWEGHEIAALREVGEYMDLVLHDAASREARRTAEERIRQQQAQLAHVSRLNTLGEMVAGISHELQQPLYAIANYAGSCARALDGDAPELLGDARDWARQIAVQAQRAKEIVARLKNFARKAQQPRKQIVLGELLAESLEFVRSEARRRNAELRCSLGSEPLVLRGDAVQLQQVVVNLLHNALDAVSSCAAERRKVLLSAEERDGEAWVSVEDRGCGLPAGVPVERIFEPFFTTKEEGLGIGLAVVRTILADHGGRIFAQAGDPGARFVFVLPLDHEGNEA